VALDAYVPSANPSSRTEARPAVAAENFTCPAYGLVHSIDRFRQCRMLVTVDAFILRLRQSDDQSERGGEVAHHPHQQIVRAGNCR
jgi:predicted RNA-binding Zn-ribbon protein involved in translation (DUF1610 family)